MQRLRVILATIALVAATAHGADDPLEEAGALCMSGRAADAQPLLVALATDADRRHDTRRQATARLLLGTADAALQQPDAARAELRNATSEFASLDDWLAVWLTTAAAAQLERNEGQIDAALRHHREALEAIRAASDVPMSLEVLKSFSGPSGIRIDALGPLSNTSELMKPLLLQFAETLQRDAYAAALIDAGELDEAEAQLAHASANGTLFASLTEPSIAVHRGDLALRRWCFDEARDRYRDALASFRRPVLFGAIDERAQLAVLDRLARTEQLGGDIDAALAWNDQALKVGASDSRRRASVLEDRAGLLLDANRYDDADRVFHESLRIAETSGDVGREASVLAGLGAMNFFRGRYGTAASDLERAIDRFECAGNLYGEAPVWGTLAEVYAMLESPENVRMAIDRGRAVAKRVNFAEAALLMDFIEAASRRLGHFAPEDLSLSLLFDNPAVAGTLPPGGGQAALPVVPTFRLMLRSYALFREGKDAEARAVCAEALSTTPGGDLRAALFALMGASYWREGKESEATRSFTQSAAALDLAVDDIRVDELLGGYAGGARHAYFEVLVELLLRQGKIERAFEVAEHARARAFLQMVGRTRLRAAGAVSEALVREAETLRISIAKWETAIPQPTEQLEQTRRRYAALLTRIKASDPEYASAANVEPLPVAAVQSRLRGGMTLVSYFLTGRGAHAWIVDDATLRHVALPLGDARLSRILCWADDLARHRYSERGVKPVVERCQGGTATAEEAYEALFAPLKPYVRHERLIIVPYGGLHYVPFAALRDPATRRYLIDDYVLTYAPSASATCFLRARNTPITRKALVLGDPAGPAAPRLTGAEEEAVAVAAKLGTTALLGAAATKQALMEHGDVSVIHIAAHGEYDPMNPLFSRIALAAGNDIGGNLEVHEILSSLDLSRVDLVVLSACESGRGKRGGGDDVVGLTSALLYAGTSGVIATLWSIDDNGAERLMKDFYDHYCAGDTAADALRKAQVQALHGANADPRDWAAFVLTGDPQGRWTQ